MLCVKVKPDLERARHRHQHVGELVLERAQPATGLLLHPHPREREAAATAMSRERASPKIATTSTPAPTARQGGQVEEHDRTHAASRPARGAASSLRQAPRPLEPPLGGTVETLRLGSPAGAGVEQRHLPPPASKRPYGSMRLAEPGAARPRERDERRHEHRSQPTADARAIGPQPLSNSAVLIASPASADAARTHG